MPSKIKLDENLWFLFICLQKSDYKTIDFNAVGQATNLKSPAAKMRYIRLRRQIEGGTLTGMHGIPLFGTAEKVTSEVRKQSRVSRAKHDAIESPALFSKMSLPDIKIKSELEDFSYRCEVDSIESDSSEDETPLAKRRNDNIKPGHALSETALVANKQLAHSSEQYDQEDSHMLELKPQPDTSLSQLEFHGDLLYACNDNSSDNRSYISPNRRFDFIAHSGKKSEDPRNL